MNIEIEDLQACGNCINYAPTKKVCLKTDGVIDPCCVCSEWEWDILNQMDRIIESQEFLPDV